MKLSRKKSEDFGRGWRAHEVRGADSFEDRVEKSKPVHRTSLSALGCRSMKWPGCELTRKVHGADFLQRSRVEKQLRSELLLRHESCTSAVFLAKRDESGPSISKVT